MTFEKILNVFSEQLKKDKNVEVVEVKRGYLHLYWEEKANEYEPILLTSLDELLERLLYDIEGFYRWESDVLFSSDTEREEFVKKLQEALYKKCKE